MTVLHLSLNAIWRQNDDFDPVKAALSKYLAYTRCWYCTGVLARCVASVGTSSVQQLWHGAASDLSSAAVSVNTEAAEDGVWSVEARSTS